MEKRYELLKVPELTGMRDIIAQVGDDPKYIVLKKLYRYIESNGAVRSDVYDYLMENMCFQDYSLSVLNNLMKLNAGPEWLDLIKQTEEREAESAASNGNVRLFQQIINVAYEGEIPVHYVADALARARYPYELNQRIEQYHNNRYSEMSDVMAGLRVVMEELQQDKQQYTMTQQELAANIDRMSKTIKEKDEIIHDLHGKLETIMDNLTKEEDFVDPLRAEENQPDVEYMEEPDYIPEDAFYEAEEDEPESAMDKYESPTPASAELKEFLDEMKRETERQREETRNLISGMSDLFSNMLNAFASGGIKPAVQESVENEAADTENVADIEAPQELPEEVVTDGIEPSVETSAHSVQTRTELPGAIVTTKKNTRDLEKRIGFFQKIREKKKISDFEKLSNTKKLEALFRMMSERNYNDTLMIMAKNCLDLDVSFEFLYAFIEDGNREEDFRKLILFRSKEPNSKTDANHGPITDHEEAEGGEE